MAALLIRSRVGDHNTVALVQLGRCCVSLALTNLCYLLHQDEYNVQIS